MHPRFEDFLAAKAIIISERGTKAEEAAMRNSACIVNAARSTPDAPFCLRAEQAAIFFRIKLGA